MLLIIGNKKYSSWSLRPWLVLKQFKIDFKEKLIRVHRKDSLENIRHYSPAGRVPILIHGKNTVWDSLAICEYLAENFQKQQLWPSKIADRAVARSISSEMHSGFSSLRTELPMDCGRLKNHKKISPSTRADIARIQNIWETAVEKSGGPFLFGDFSIADAMFAPVCLRFRSYRIKNSPLAQVYQTTILSLPSIQAWVTAGTAEEFPEKA